MWTNASFPPVSGVINPKPLVVLKNFTVPLIDDLSSRLEDPKVIEVPRWNKPKLRLERLSKNDARSGAEREPAKVPRWAGSDRENRSKRTG